MVDDKKKNGDDKRYIGFNVTDETKKQWQEFANENKISTISKLIRESVDFYINTKPKLQFLDKIDKITHGFKESLTSIKGFSQILIEEYKEELSWEILTKIKNIFDESIKLEEKISEVTEQFEIESAKFDILIIDDDDSTINLLKDYFEKKNHVCKVVTKGNDALKVLNRSIPKLILLDIFLPDITGYEVCKQIRAHDKLKKIPLFYITAVPEGEVSENIKETGANGYFLKPFDILRFKQLYQYL